MSGRWRGWPRSSEAALAALLAAGLAAPASGAEPLLYGSAGFLFQNVGGRASGAGSGAGSAAGSFFPNFGLSGRVPTGLGGLKLVPAASYTLFSMPDSEGAAGRTIFTLSLSASLPVGSAVDVRLGTGNLWYRVGGNGGSFSLNNGSTVSTFYAPDGAVSARLWYLSAGAGLELDVSFPMRVDLDAWVTAPFSSARRAVSAAVMVAYGFL